MKRTKIKQNEYSFIRLLISGLLIMFAATGSADTPARTCFFDGQYLYLAVPKRGTQSAEIRCYRVGT